MPAWDVIVVGAGPAGSMAAWAARGAGASVLLVDKAELPRYKRCGGGLTGASLAALPPGFAAPLADRVGAVTASLGMRRERTRRAQPFLAMTMRAAFDHALALHAVAAGAELRTGVTVRGAEDDGSAVRVRTDDGDLRAAALVAADGVHSRIARSLPLAFDQVDFALEAEVLVPDDIAARWAGRVHIDVGTVPGGYGWLFPKGRILTVGVIAPQGQPERLRAYLEAYLAHLGLSGYPRQHEGGHRTRTRSAASPLLHGRVIPAGDAAGWVDPWLREGISYALRSGRAAGEAAAAIARGASPDAILAACAQELHGDLDAGAALLRMQERSAWAVHAALVSGPGWRAFRRIAGGETSLGRALAHPVAGRVARALGAR